ncbi:MAG: cellobiose phosphorylase [Candidatus Omnitrophica bacterium]|nr:cellobiose phosphorylase [Candidatus Omnitrophota bacterium]
MIYKFIDLLGTFTIENPHRYNLYFPLTNSRGTLLNAVSPNLAGDIKRDDDHFLSIPASIEDVRNNLLCRREFFLKLNKEVIRLSRPCNDTLECGLLYQKIFKSVKSLSVEILNFVPYDLDVEVMTVTITNKGKNALEITPTSFLALFGRSERNLRDHRHVTSLLNYIELDKYGIRLKPTVVFDERGSRVNETTYFVYGYEGAGIAPLGQFPTLDYFLGDSDILAPDAVEKNIKPVNKKINSFDGKEACGALRFRTKKIKAQESLRYTLVMGIANDTREIKKTFAQLDNPDKVERKLKETKEYWRDSLADLTFDFKDKNYNNWVLWVKLQPTLRKLFGCSFLPHFDYGKGGRGWRDLWQDALSLLLTENGKAKDAIINNFKGVRIDGSNATIIANDGTFISDRNKISRVWMDHGVWPYLTLRYYIQKSADLSILLKEVGYFKDHQLARAKLIDREFKQEDYLLRKAGGAIYEGSILEHLLLQTLVQFFNVGEHNIIRLENADWNDGLDLAPQRGESVTFSCMYAHNLKDICAILAKLEEKYEKVTLLKEIALLLDSQSCPINYNNAQEKQKRLDEYFEKTKALSGEKIAFSIAAIINDLSKKAQSLTDWIREKEWLPEGFFNGYYDNLGRRVEGKINGVIRMNLASQVFAIMSGVADEKQVRQIWVNANKNLRDKKSGGFRLNTDFGFVYLELGRAFGFIYGDKENGAYFNHMDVMFANALYKRNFINEGYDVLNSIYAMAKAKRAAIAPGIPEYFNDAGRGLYSYLTGSASWYTYTLFDEAIGIKFSFADIVLQPKLTEKNFKSAVIEVAFSFLGKDIQVSFIKEGNGSGRLKVKKVILEEKTIQPQSGLGYIIKKEELSAFAAKKIAITVILAER